MAPMRTLLVMIVAVVCGAPAAAQTRVQIHDLATGAERGTIMVEAEPRGGVRFTPDLDGILPTGGHGFHLHENPDCGDGGLAAGGHYDPENTGVHAGPHGDGHLGALPRLESDGGRVTAAVVAPRLAMDDVFGRALVIHEGGDNYSDVPSPNGGGGPRMACGVIATVTPVMPPAALAALIALLLAIAAHARRRAAPAPNRG